MNVQGQLIGIESPFSYKDKKTGQEKHLQSMHILLPQDDPSNGFSTLSGMIDPSFFEEGKEPSKYPRQALIGLKIDANRGAQITSVKCQ